MACGSRSRWSLITQGDYLQANELAAAAVVRPAMTRSLGGHQLTQVCQLNQRDQHGNKPNRRISVTIVFQQAKTEDSSPQHANDSPGFCISICSKNNFLKFITVGRTKYVLMKCKAMFLKLIHFSQRKKDIKYYYLRL